MKAYKYHRGSAGYHWTMGLSETIVYIPELNIMLYESNTGGMKSVGTTKKEYMLNEAKDYINKVQIGIVPKSEPIISKKNSTILGFGTAYSNVSVPRYSIGYTNEYVMEIPSHTIGMTTYSAVTLSNFKEVDIEFDVTQVEELDKLNELKEKYDGIIKNIIK